MSAAPSLGIPELAGVCRYADATRQGMSVEECVMLLRRFDYIERRLYYLATEHLTATPEWEVKCGISLHLYQDAEHSSAFRSRVAELRKPPLHLDVCPDSRLEALMDEVLRSDSTLELLVGIYEVVRPALLAAYQAYESETHPLIDYPTRRALRLPILEEREAIAWGLEAAAALVVTDESRESARAWKDHLEAYLAAAGGISGRSEIPDDLELPVPRTAEPYVPDFRPRRDDRFHDLYNFNYRPSIVARDPTRPMLERNLALMYKRLHEMDVPEMMAAMIAQTRGKPWEYYRDLGRQLWDECRHSMMGEIWFEAHGIDWTRTPNHVGWSFLLNQERTPLERHAILFSVEHSLMAKTGKRFEWELAQSSGDPLSAYFQDFDWADEVLHKNIGLRWLKPDLDEVERMLDLAEEATSKPHPELSALQASHAQFDWWPEFVTRALGEYQPGEPGEVATAKGGLTSMLKQSGSEATARRMNDSSG